jgi:hypothetical protein
MRYTLLDMVQTTLSSLDSDNVNSIDDTIESRQVVDIVRTVYNDMISRANLPDHFTFFELEASGNPSKPTLMTKPNTCAEIVWIKYDNKTTANPDTKFQPVMWQPMDEFIDRMLSLKPSDSDVFEFIHNIGTATINIKGHNDRFPKFYTTFDDDTLVFDSYNALEETTLTGNRTMVYGQKFPFFIRENSWVPEIDLKQFSILLNEVKALAFSELKQVPNASAERQARRGWVHNQKHKQEIGRKHYHPGPNFGRK